MSGGFDSRKDSHNRVYITESTLQIHNIHYRYTTLQIHITESPLQSHRHHTVIAESTLKIHITESTLMLVKRSTIN